MIDPTKAQKNIEDFLQKMTMQDAMVHIAIEPIKEPSQESKISEVLVVDIQLKEPQFLIGQDGKTLLDMQKLLRMMLCKKFGENFYLKLDINDYQKQKIDHLRRMAQDAADEAVALGQKKALPPMSSYQRRIVHEELSKRDDVAAESQGEGESRCIVISPK